MEEFRSIVVLIPAYKPSQELNTLILALLREGFARIVVVDDGSGAEFEEVFTSLPDVVLQLKHEVNRGKGSALKTGLAYINATYGGSFGVVTCDADGQHTPADIGRVAKALLESEGDVLILGSRAFKGDVPLRSAFGNQVTRGIFYLTSGVGVYDTQTGLRAFPHHLLPMALDISGERYEYEMNVLLEAAKLHLEIREVEIRTVYIDGNKTSHFRAFRDSAQIIREIMRFSLTPSASFGIDFAMLLFIRYFTANLPYGISLFMSVLGARAISLVAKSLMNSVLFRMNRRKALIKYWVFALRMTVMNYILLYLLTVLLSLPLVWSKLVTELLLIPVGYFVQKKDGKRLHGGYP